MIIDITANMKNNIIAAKKLSTVVSDKKVSYNSNPYNDLPSTQLNHATPNANKLIKVAPKMPENSRPQALKINKMTSPDVPKTGALSPSSNKDSMSKFKNPSLDPNKKIVKKVVKNEKYNDYFEGDMGAKKQINLSQKSAQSNNSVKSVHSQNKKLIVPHKQVSKVIKPVVNKVMPVVAKVQPANHTGSKFNSHEFNQLLSQLPTSKPTKPGEDRKTWSYTAGVNNHSKSNSSKQLQINKGPIFPAIDFKNTRNTTGNPQQQKKVYGSEPRSGSSIQKTAKILQNKKQGTKFVPSASKSQSPDKFKKIGQVQKLSSPKLDKKKSSQLSMKSLDKKESTQANSKQSLKIENNIFELNHVISLGVVSLHGPRTISLKIVKYLSKDEKTSLYLVKQVTTNMLYCLKKCEIVAPHDTKQENILNKLQYLIRQGKIGNFINHPNLIRTYCTLYDKNHIYQLMQFIEGKNLYDRNKSQFCESPAVSQRDSLGLQKSPLEKIINKLYCIKQILYQLLDALCYLHERGIIHRDIKPANILITHENNYKIGDFGTAICKNSAQPIGTLDYAAPEIMLKEPYTASVDIWAVGCIAFELYVGYPPFFNQNRQNTIQKIIACEYEHKLIYDEGLSNLVSKMLQKKGEKRITAKQALQHCFIREFKAIQKEL